MEDVRIKAFLAIETGYGDGSGSGVLKLNGKDVYKVDGVNTIITWVNGNIAKGFILQKDLSLNPCFIVKGEVNGKTVFAHGDDLRQAMQALTDKLFDGMPEEERIRAFMKDHPEYDKAYPNQDLFDWHHRLTGSCLAGRNAFVNDHGLSLDGQTTVAEFVRLTRYAYGMDVIRMLEKAYRDRDKEA